MFRASVARTHTVRPSTVVESLYACNLLTACLDVHVWRTGGMSATLQARNIDPCHMRLIGMVGLLGTECWTEKGPCGAGAWNHGGQFGTSAHTSASVPCKCVHNSDPRRNKVSTISPSRVQWYDAVFYPRCGGQLRFFFFFLSVFRIASTHFFPFHATPTPASWG